MPVELTLPEELLILGIDDTHRFKLHFRSHQKNYTVGTVLLELLLREIIEMDEKGRLILTSSSMTGVPYLDRVIQLLAEHERKPKNLKKWIIYFGNRNRLRNQVNQAVLESLQTKEVLKVEQSRFLFIPVKKFVVNMDAREYVVQKIRAELLEEGPVEAQTVLLVFLLERAKLLGDYFSHYEEKQLKSRLKELKEQDQQIAEWVKSVRKAMDEMDAAITTIIATTAS
ncbi:Golgi phosphoprotein 3 (GPP34) [Lihuaxuella thermophila]|uniref:Golgi phosphoprotein 3 (GPP34) n=2 Tax=Lihuaxuella thermophila TaxID=1173111 RepID=A0A1H8C276_9BACL|nr:Golgi phosphoprotein 3 (GPP34) [Lihuaxuella thermophila]